MRKLSKIISLVLVISLVFSLIGCSNSDEEKSVIYNTTTLIHNIDPQLANNETEFQIVYNTFEGLFKYNEKSEIVNGVVDSYKVKNNGLTYEFKLKSDIKWANGEPLTAYDFEFGFRRAVDKNINSPYSYLLLPIKNAEKILKGKMKANKIGVKAINDKELKITLDYPAENFLEILTMPISMPCNEEFYTQCKGYYGLDEDKILNNGFYSVKNWNEEYCSLIKNDNYNGFESLTTAVFIYFNDNESFIESMNKNEVNFSILTNKLTNEIIKKKSIKTKKISDTTNSLFINKNSLIAEDNILSALYSSIDFDINDEQNELYGINRTNFILPSIVENHDKLKITNSKKLSDEDMKKSFIVGCENLDIDLSFPAISIIYIDDIITENIAKQIAAKWQLDFGVTVNIKPLNDINELSYNIKNGYFDAVIFPSTAQSDSASLFFQQFSSSFKNNYIGYKNSSFDKNLKKLNKTNDKIKTIQKLNDKICNNKYIYPLFESSKLYYLDDNTNIFINEKNKIAYFYY